MEYQDDIDESREISHICTICNYAEARNGLDSLCLKCYVESAHRMIERNKPITVMPFKVVREPITNTLSESMAKIEIFDPFDMKLSKIEDKVYVVGYIRK